jgi:hypothetical protein
MELSSGPYSSTARRCNCRQGESIHGGRSGKYFRSMKNAVKTSNPTYFLSTLFHCTTRFHGLHVRLISQVGGPPLFGCPRLLIRHIGSYPLYLEAVGPIRNLKGQDHVEDLCIEQSSVQITFEAVDWTHLTQDTAPLAEYVNKLVSLWFP